MASLLPVRICSHDLRQRASEPATRLPVRFWQSAVTSERHYWLARLTSKMRSKHFRLGTAPRNILICLISSIETPRPDVARLSTPCHVYAAIRAKYLAISQRNFCAWCKAGDVQRSKSWLPARNEATSIRTTLAYGTTDGGGGEKNASLRKLPAMFCPKSNTQV